MIAEEIKVLRDILNSKAEFESLCDERILTISQDLDKLILEYYRLSSSKNS